MVWAKKSIKAEYPGFYNWLYTELPQVRNKRKVWKAFLKWSGLGTSADLYLGSGSMPEIRVEPLIDAQGMYSSKFKNTIFIDSFVVAYFEANSSRDDAKMLVESTVLHEMCHWAVSSGVISVLKDDYGKGNAERGKHFEMEAYKGDVSLKATKNGVMVKKAKFNQNKAN